MSAISETEIKAMTKEQNYMRGYEDGKIDVLDKIRAEIEGIELLANYTRGDIKRMALDIIDKYKAGSEDKE